MATANGETKEKQSEMNNGAALMKWQRAASSFEEKLGALKVQKRRKKTLISVPPPPFSLSFQPSLLLPLLLLRASPPSFPPFSNFPEDGGACLAGT